MDTVSATLAVQWTQCLLHWRYNGHSVCYNGGTMDTVSATLAVQWTQCLLHWRYNVHSVCYTGDTMDTVSATTYVVDGTHTVLFLSSCNQNPCFQLPMCWWARPKQ